MTREMVITLRTHNDVDVLRHLMHLGIREHLISPIQDFQLSEAVGSAARRLKANPVSGPRPGDLYTFLPAKPGVGTSTIAMSTSCALAEDLGLKTLLLDADLAAGTIQFLLKLGTSSSIVDGLIHADALDEDLWQQIVGKWDKLEVLHAGALDTPPGMDVPGLDRVVAMARAQYEVICADLGSLFDPLSVALLRESRRVFLVTTAELAPLHLAQIRILRLNELGLGDRVSLLLNRKLPSEISDSEVEAAVGLNVAHSFSNDYKSVKDSILRGSPVHGGSLGESILSLAQSLAPHVEPKRSATQRKFLQFFHVPSARDIESVGL